MKADCRHGQLVVLDQPSLFWSFYFMQKDNPGSGKESNWLPAPGDPIYMAMRIDWPKTDTACILPPGEGAGPPGAS